MDGGRRGREASYGDDGAQYLWVGKATLGSIHEWCQRALPCDGGKHLTLNAGSSAANRRLCAHPARSPKRSRKRSPTRAYTVGVNDL